MAKKKTKSAGGHGGGGATPQSFGSRVGSKIGGWVGDLAQKAISTITGMGDYEVKENSIVSSLGGSKTVPQFLAGGGCTRIAHREFVGSVQSAGSTFSVTSFALNPSNASLFPWLSEIAFSFETFRFRGCVVEFVSTYGDAVASANAALGSVILATSYNASAPPFSSQSSMENYEYATSTKPSVSMIHPIECDPSQLVAPHLYVYQGTTGAADPRWTTHGVISLGTVGQQSAGVLGELWVSYDIELYQPKLLSAIPTSGLGIHYYAINPSSALLPNTMLTGITNFPPPSDLGFNVGVIGDLVMAFPSINSSLIAFPPGLNGDFSVTLFYQCQNGTTNTSPPNSTGTPPRILGNGGSLISFSGSHQGAFNGPYQALGAGVAGSSPNASFLIVFTVRINNSTPNAACQIDFSPTISSGWSNPASNGSYEIDLFITAVPY